MRFARGDNFRQREFFSFDSNCSNLREGVKCPQRGRRVDPCPQTLVNKGVFFNDVEPGGFAIKQPKYHLHFHQTSAMLGRTGYWTSTKNLVCTPCLILLNKYPRLTVKLLIFQMHKLTFKLTKCTIYDIYLLFTC